MKKKLLSTALLLIVSATLASCSNSKKDDNNNNSSDTVDIVEDTYYTIEFETNSVGTTISSQRVKENDFFDIYSIQAPTKAKTDDYTYEFDCWCTDENLQNPFDATLPITSNLKLYAKYRAINNCLVSFNTDGGTPMDSIHIPAGSQIGNIEAPQKISSNTTDYVFDGWYYDSAFHNQYHEYDRINQNTTLFAKWNETDRVYYIQYHSNYSGGPIYYLVQYHFGDTLVAKEAISRESSVQYDYTFTGWYTDDECNNLFDFDNASIYWDKYLHLFAGWEETTRNYTINLETNGGNISETSIQVPYNTEIPLEDIEEPTKDSANRINYSFAGWYLDEELKNPVTGNEKCLGEMTLYAKWNEEEMTPYELELNEYENGYIVTKMYNSKAIIIPETYNSLPVVEIAPNAAKELTNIQHLVLPKTITKIGTDAFKDAKIKEFYYNGSISEWVGIKFANEKSNPGSISSTSYFIEEDTTNPGLVYYKGNYYKRPTCIVIPGSVDKISNYAFYNMYFDKVIISEGVEEIGDLAFYSTKSTIERMYVPKTVTKIGRYALDPTRHLYYGGSNSDWGNIEMGVGAGVGINERINDVFNDDGYMFAVIDGTNYLLQYLGNDGIVDLSRPFPEALNNGSRYNIKKSAFENDITIRKVIISDYVDTIEQYAFYEAYSLNVLVINSSSTTFAEKSFLYAFNLFELYNLTNLSVPETSKLHYYPVVTHESIDEASIIHNIDGFLFVKKDNDWWLIGCDTYNPYLVLPSSLEIDGEPVSEYYVSEDVFGRNTILELKIPSSAIIDRYSLHYIIKYSSPVIYLENIEEIYSYYFNGGFDLVLPNTIEKIYEDAFVYLEGTLYFMGTKEEWNAIENEDDNISISDIYFYSETKPVETGKYFHLVDRKVVVWE